MIPGCFQYLQALAVVAIAAIGAWLAWQQVQIASVKLQHDLYDRRYRVFDATRTLLVNLCRKGNASDEDMRAFVLGTGDAAFLFGDALTRYLEDMTKRASDLHSIHLMIENRLSNAPPVKEQTRDRITEHQKWFGEQLTKIVSKFEPDLKLDKRHRAQRNPRGGHDGA